MLQNFVFKLLTQDNSVRDFPEVNSEGTLVLNKF